MPLVFGLAQHAPEKPDEALLGRLLELLSTRLGLQIVAAYSQSYDELTARFVQGEVSFAWLPPIPFIALERAKVATPIVAHHRAGQPEFEAVLVVPADSRIRTLHSLQGKRIAWVDSLSASGYVLPRIQLAALGVDPRTAFGAEGFYGSHDAAVRAVLDGRADVAATYANSWGRVSGAKAALRVLISFGAIPGDVIAARRALDKRIRHELTEALIGLSSEVEGAELAQRVFGVEAFRAFSGGVEGSYNALRAAMADAATRGLLDAIQTLEARSL